MDDGVLHIPLQVPLIEAVLQDLDPAAEQGVDKVLIGMADLVRLKYKSIDVLLYNFVLFLLSHQLRLAYVKCFCCFPRGSVTFKCIYDYGFFMITYGFFQGHVLISACCFCL